MTMVMAYGMFTKSDSNPPAEESVMDDDGRPQKMRKLECECRTKKAGVRWRRRSRFLKFCIRILSF